MPAMQSKVRPNLITAGLIMQCAERVFRTGQFAIRIPGYEMPSPGYIQWRFAVDATDE